jgi:hypothetical protein
MEIYEYDKFQFDMLLKKKLIRDTILELSNLLTEPKGSICVEDEITIQKIIEHLTLSHSIGAVTSYPFSNMMSDLHPLEKNKIYIVKKIPDDVQQS